MRTSIRVAALLALLGLGFALGRRTSGEVFARLQFSPPRDTVAIANHAFSRCGGLKPDEKMKCYDDILLPLAASGRVRLALGTLGRLGMLEREVAYWSHQYAHSIGMTALVPGRNVNASFESCTANFQSGCYHGVIQAYLSREPAVGAAEVNALCLPYRGNQADHWLFFQCVHGMGHGLSMHYGHDLPRALQGCDLLAEVWDQEACYGGVFMENIASVLEAGGSPMLHAHDHASGPASTPAVFRRVDPADPYYPCSIVSARYLAACYESQPIVMLALNHLDFAVAERLCTEAPRSMRYNCYEGIGTQISGTVAGNRAESVRLCSLGDHRYQAWCFAGVGRSLVNGSAEAAPGFAFCREVPGRGNQLRCYAALGDEIALLHNTLAERSAACSAAPGEYVNACRYGAGLLADPPQGLPLADTAVSAQDPTDANGRIVRKW